MVYAPGGQIDATDYSGMIGYPTGTPFNSNNVLRPFANSTEATQKMAGIYGIGFGDRGYGQTGANLPVGRLNLITASHWSALRTTVETAGNHQGTDITNLVPASQLVSGQVINAHDGSNYSLSNLIEPIDNNRFNTNSGKSMTLSSNVSTDARSFIWSGNITSTFRYTWSTVDEARYFFNSGGELRIRLTQGTVTTSQDTNWHDIFTTKLGTYSFRARDAVITGTSTASLNVGVGGYYDLPNSSAYRTSFFGINIGGGLYSVNDLIIEVRVQGTADHGGPGTQVDIRVVLRDQHTNAFFDQVSVGTTYRTDIFRATAVLAGIVAPSISINDTFD